jgi:hypothetical protein
MEVGLQRAETVLLRIYWVATNAGKCLPDHGRMYPAPLPAADSASLFAAVWDFTGTTFQHQLRLDLGSSQELAGAVEGAARAGLWLELLLSYPLHGRAAYAAYFSANPATRGRSGWPRQPLPGACGRGVCQCCSVLRAECARRRCA